MRGSFRLLLSVVIVAFWIGSATATTIFSEDFSLPTLDPAKWDTSTMDGISVTSDQRLKMEDVAPGNTFLFSGNEFIVGAGNYRFEMDFQANLSPLVPDGTFPDAFTVALGSDLLIVVDVPNGTAILPTTLTIKTINEWSHLAYDFTLSADTDIAPWFTLADQNTILDANGNPVDFVSNSTVLLDNVQISSIAEPVPEPSTLLLVGAGLTGLAVMRRRGRT